MDETDVNISRETQVSIPEHEILLSFNDDDMAESFHEWWYAVGETQFIQFYNKNEE